MLGFTAFLLGPALGKGEREDSAEGRAHGAKAQTRRIISCLLPEFKVGFRKPRLGSHDNRRFFFFEVSVDDESSLEWPEVRFFCCCCFCYGLLAEAFRSVRGLGRVRKTSLNWRVIVCVAKGRDVSQGCSQ